MTEYVMEYDGWAEGIPVGEYLRVRDAMHARKREEVVRCRDCRYYKPNTYSHFTCELLMFHVDPDGFCAWGERKEVNE